MARKLPIRFPGAIYHCLNRGNQRQPIPPADEDYRFFLDALASAWGKLSVRWHRQCRMPNHYHLLNEVAEIPRGRSKMVPVLYL